MTLNLWDLDPWRDDALSQNVGGNIYRVPAPRERARRVLIDRSVERMRTSTDTAMRLLELYRQTD
jgi:hypothetical protein